MKVSIVTALVLATAASVHADGSCQELTDVFKSDDYKQCVNSLGGKWQTPQTFLTGATESPNKSGVPDAMCTNDACKRYISKVKSINADNCPFNHRGIDLVVKKSDFELERIEKACGKNINSTMTAPTTKPATSTTPKPTLTTPTGACQNLTDVFKSDEYKQCVNELKGKWQTPLTFLLGAESPNKEVPDTMCKNAACQKYISNVKSINADNCPFSHRGIDMVVKKADFELERIDKACGAAAGKSGSKSNDKTNSDKNTKNSTTSPSTTGAASRAGSGDVTPHDDSIVTPTPSSKPALREGAKSSTPAPTKTSSASSLSSLSMASVSSVAVVCVGTLLHML